MRLEIEQNVHSLGYADDHVADVFTVPAVDASRLFKQGVSAAQNGERDLARTLLCRVTETEPQNADAWLWLASISEYPEELLGFLSNVLEIDPENARAREWKIATMALLAKTFVQRGINAQSEGQTSFAMDCFDNAIDHDSRCESAWVWKASLADSEEQRVTCLEQVLSINPENEDAIQALRSISDSHQQAKLNDARSAALEGEPSKAENILDEIIESDPLSIEAWTLRSQVVVSFEEKLACYERMSEIDPSNELGRAGSRWMANIIEDVKSITENSVDEAAAEECRPFETENPFSANVVEFRSNEHVYDGEQNSESDQEQTSSSFEPYSNNEVETGEYVEASPASIGANDVITGQFEAEEHIPEPVEELPLEFEIAVSESADFAEQVFDHVTEPEAQLPSSYHNPDGDSESDIEFVTEAGPSFSQDPIEPRPDASDARIETVDGSCPYCGSGNDLQAFECSNCRAFLSLSDIESVLSNGNADRESIQQSVTQMEAEWNLREFDEKELTTLGIGHLNLRNYDSGFAYLQEAARLNPNNVILAGQVNAIAIRLDEIRRQIEDHETMPKGKNILVVDDSATVRKLISSKLEKSGHIVVCAEDGVEAMAMMENMVPDLVLLDITMPRMDGYSVCKLIRSNESTRNVPVVMISGKDGFFDKVRGRMAGTTGYITKPFGPETLMRALETYLLPDAELAVVGE